jgi:hypothetical protein
MPKTKISEFSATPGNNTDIDGINVAEGCAPSGINDAIRELMAQLKDFQAGTAGDSFNGPVGTTTAAAGAFTTLSASSTTTLSGGTANGVAYLNGSKVVTTGSALTFDGTNLGVSGNVSAGSTSAGANVVAYSSSYGSNGLLRVFGTDGNNKGSFGASSATTVTLNARTGVSMIFEVNDAEQMRLTSTGLGVGASTPADKLDVAITAAAPSNSNFLGITVGPTSGSTAVGEGVGIGFRIRNTAGGAIGGNGFGAAIYGVQTNTAANTGGLAFYTRSDASTFSERLRLDSSGNLGLGVTPSAWATNSRVLQVINSSLETRTDNPSYSTVVANGYINTSSSWRYVSTDYASRYTQFQGQHLWYTAPSGTAGNAISFTQALTLDANRNLLLNGTSAGASSVGTFTIFNGTAPTGSVTDGVILFAADVSSSSELRVRDEAGNVTTLSPHNFSLIPEGPSEELAWAYYSEKGGKRINVDMLKLARMVEKLTGEKLVYES